jgi:hypothetical protein
MSVTKLDRVILFALLCVALAVGCAQQTPAQSSSQSTRAATDTAREDETNLDTQLYLILATNRDIEEGKIPVALEPVVKRLRESLTFKHYNLAATFLNRVKNNGRLDVSWVGAPLLILNPAATSNPTFSQFSASVKLGQDQDGREVVRMNEFRFGSRVPIITGQTSTTVASTSAPSFPMISYEPIGLHTDISMREGVPVVAGTLNVGPSGDAIVVVIAARRSAN